jgi:glutamate---cysteine ligase / carboxylate-amine ligase
VNIELERGSPFGELDHPAARTPLPTSGNSCRGRRPNALAGGLGFRAARPFPAIRHCRLSDAGVWGADLIADTSGVCDVRQVAVSTFARSRNLIDGRPAPTVRDPVARVIGCAHDARPAWAVWNDDLKQPYTLGVEEEVMLLQPGRWSLAQSSDEVLARLSRELSRHASPETHASVLELTTGIHADVDGIVGELARLRNRLTCELGAMGLSAAAAGTHPVSVWEETRVSNAVRYRDLGDSLRVLARREPTMALHVHIGVPTPEGAIRVLNGLRDRIPLLLALSANSPFWQGRDSGFASARTLIFQAFPRAGLPRFFGNYGDYVEAVDALIGSGSVPDPSFLWWDIRLQPALGTVEVRVMDAQSTVSEVAPLVALIQSLARLEVERDVAPVVPGAEVLAENRFLAARDGMDARLIDPRARSLVPAREMLDALITECRPHAVALGCASALDRVPRIAAASGANRQRAIAARQGSLEQVVAQLVARFPAPGSSAGTAGS